MVVLKPFIAHEAGFILDEYDRRYASDEFFAFVDRRQAERAQRRQERSPQEYPPSADASAWLDRDGYTFANYDFS
jgi:hypothetical protein